jgi:cytochrome c-type biogenesis protein CcsB
MNTLITFLLIILTANLQANSYFCNKQLEELPIEQGGRVKPLYVHAKETIKNLSGKSKVADYDALTAYCLLSLKGIGMPNEIDLKTKIEHVELKKFLGLGEKEHEMSFNAILPKEEAIGMEIRLAKNNESYKKSLTRLYNDLYSYKSIINGEDWKLYLKNEKEEKWVPMYQYLTEDKVILQKTKTPDDPFTPVLLLSKENYIKSHGDKYLIELRYSKLSLSNWALLITLLALGSLVLTQNFKLTLFLSFLTIVIQTILMGFRVYISGRAPITNMYETVLFSGYGSLLLALILGHFKKENIFVYMGLAYNLCTLMMINFANGMLTATISPLVPVLRDNFWLSTHVTTIMLSYGALALSWIMANTALIKRRLNKISKEEENKISEIIYTTLKWGTTLLGAGIILGGVWADYSWGRFWGWDPKETWSLIVLCIYMAILHGRHTSWIKNERFITITAGAFLSVLMAWFGVNYILASGLHSYGFSEGGAIFIGSVFLGQILIIVSTYNYKRTNLENKVAV